MAEPERGSRCCLIGISTLRRILISLEGVDRTNDLVALEGPKGVEKVLKVRNPEILDQIQVGDKVKTTFARALVLDITPGPAG